MAPDDLPLFALWETFLRDLLSRTRKFPKAVRFTFTTRIDNLALDVLELLIQARWRRDKQAELERVSVNIDKLRILLRICHDEAFLDHRGFEHVIRGLDEAGRMVGGWIKQQARA